MEPAFLSPLQNLTVNVGRNATFTCFVSHIQEYRVSKTVSYQFQKLG